MAELRHGARPVLGSVVALVFVAAAAGGAGCGDGDEASAPARGSGENLLWISLCGVRADVLDECIADGSAPAFAGLKRRGGSMAATGMALSSNCRGARLGPENLAAELTGAGCGTAAFVSRSELAPIGEERSSFARFSLPPIERFSVALAGPDAAPLHLRRSAAATSEEACAWLAHEPSPFLLWVQWNGLAVEEAVDAPPTRADARARLLGIDRALATLLAALDVAGRGARTVIVVAGDHGEALGEEDGAYGHRRPLDAVKQIPLWIVCPESVAPPADARPPRSIDEALPLLLARLSSRATPPPAWDLGPDPFDRADAPPLPWFVERGLVPLTEAQARALLPELRRLRSESKRDDLDVVELEAAALLALPKRDAAEEQELRALAPAIAAAANAEHPFAATLHARAELGPVDADERRKAAEAAVRGAPWWFPAVQTLAVRLQGRPDPAGGSAALAVLERFGRTAPLSSAARAEWEKRLAQSRANLAPPK
jgi:hypothetical protein